MLLKGKAEQVASNDDTSSKRDHDGNTIYSISYTSALGKISKDEVVETLPATRATRWLLLLGAVHLDS